MLDSDALAGTWDFKKKKVGIYKMISRARTRSSEVQVQVPLQDCLNQWLLQRPDTFHYWGQTLSTLGAKHLLFDIFTDIVYRIALQSYSHHKTVSENNSSHASCACATIPVAHRLLISLRYFTL